MDILQKYGEVREREEREFEEWGMKQYISRQGAAKNTDDGPISPRPEDDFFDLYEINHKKSFLYKVKEVLISTIVAASVFAAWILIHFILAASMGSVGLLIEWLKNAING